MRLVESEAEVLATPAKGILVRSGWQRRILTFLMVFGLGLIVMEADNDAGAVSTYMQAGGQYGLHLLWLLVVLLPICYFIEEMVAQLDIATGKGHAAMIYIRFGKWWGRFSLIDLLAVNFLTLITEFAAISLAMVDGLQGLFHNGRRLSLRSAHHHRLPQSIPNPLSGRRTDGSGSGQCGLRCRDA
jgi:hypothetical protein